MNESRNSVPTSRSKLGTRISEISKLVGGKKKLADMAGLSESQLYRYINGTSNPTVEPLVAIAEAAGVSIAWLATGEGPMRPGDLSDAERRREDIYLAEAGDQDAAARKEERFRDAAGLLQASREAADSVAAGKDLSIGDYELLRAIAGANPVGEDLLAALAARLSVDTAGAEFSQEFALIPGYSVQVAAGAGALPGAEQPSRKLAFRRKWLRFRGLNEKDLVLVFAKGDSMEPTISDNNTLMIDTSQRELTDGSIYVIRTDHHLIVKRVQTLWNKGILLLSDNKEYKEQLVEPSEADDLEVIGRVVWIGKDV